MISKLLTYKNPDRTKRPIFKCIAAQESNDLYIELIIMWFHGIIFKNRSTFRDVKLRSVLTGSGSARVPSANVLSTVVQAIEQFPSLWHYSEVIMSAMVSQITRLTSVYSNVYSVADQRKHQSFASLAFARGIHQWPVNSPHKGLVTRTMFPFDDVVMDYTHYIRLVYFVVWHRSVLEISSTLHHCQWSELCHRINL